MMVRNTGAKNFMAMCPCGMAFFSPNLLHSCYPKMLPRFASSSLVQPHPYNVHTWRSRHTFRGFAIHSSSWSANQSPYEILGVKQNAGDEEIKVAYRKMVKQYHPDVYDGSMELDKGETAESRFIKVQAAYELLMNNDQRRQYDSDNYSNPLKASKAWMEWVLKKKTAFEQRGDMAATAWAEQQQREMNLKARRMSRYKLDPEEERRILAREKQASVAHFETTLKRHTLVLKKRDLMRRKTEAESQKQLVQKLLAAEGLELAEETQQNSREEKEDNYLNP